MDIELRDYFAGQAMQAFLMRPEAIPEPIGFCFDGKELAQASYDAANWMLKGRKTQKSEESVDSSASPVQQLKAEIAEFAQSLDISKDGHFSKDFIVAKLRQLSAV